MADHENDPTRKKASSLDLKQNKRIGKRLITQEIKTTLGQGQMHPRAQSSQEIAVLRAGGGYPASPRPRRKTNRGANPKARPLNMDAEIVDGRSVNLRLTNSDATFLLAATTPNPNPVSARQDGAKKPKFLDSSRVQSEIIVNNADPELMEGSRLGNYEIVRKVGEGGMGVVYEGRHLTLPRRVAIKFLLTNQAQDQEQVHQFLREAAAATQIDHPGVVSIYNYGFDDRNAAYLVMEFAAGQTLQGVIERNGKTPIPMALRIVRDIADVLAAAHRSGIIHRDLKPDNIVLARDETGLDCVKVLDFGIAKFVSDQGMSERTEAGSILGTPWYMSPEQCQGRLTVHYQSDIYALGCVFYQMICGKVPFAGTLREILVAHINTAPVPPRNFSPSIPPRIEELILKMMAKEPTDRPISMEVVANIIEEFVEPTPERLRANRANMRAIDPHAQPPSSNPWLAPVLAALAAILVTAGVFYFLL